MDEKTNPDGNIEVSDSVLITYIEKAIGEVEGLSPSKKRKTVKISRKDNACSIEIGVDAYYGVEIPSTVRVLQRLVKERLTVLAGLQVEEVSVVVAGLNIEELIKK